MELRYGVAALRASPLNTAGELTPGDRERMTEILGDVLASGEDYRTGARRLRKTFPNITPEKALTIVWTELVRAENTGRVTGYRLAGVKRVRWSAAKDEQTCTQCRELDDQVVLIGGAFADGTKPGDTPHECCRCCIISADFDDE